MASQGQNQDLEQDLSVDNYLVRATDTSTASSKRKKMKKKKKRRGGRGDSSMISAASNRSGRGGPLQKIEEDQQAEEQASEVIEGEAMPGDDRFGGGADQVLEHPMSAAEGNVKG